MAFLFMYLLPSKFTVLVMILLLVPTVASYYSMALGINPANSEVDMPLTYADYYCVEALGRYKEFK